MRFFFSMLNIFTTSFPCPSYWLVSPQYSTRGRPQSPIQMRRLAVSLTNLGSQERSSQSTRMIEDFMMPAIDSSMRSFSSSSSSQASISLSSLDEEGRQLKVHILWYSLVDFACFSWFFLWMDRRAWSFDLEMVSLKCQNKTHLLTQTWPFYLNRFEN